MCKAPLQASSSEWMIQALNKGFALKSQIRFCASLDFSRHMSGARRVLIWTRNFNCNIFLWSNNSFMEILSCKILNYSHPIFFSLGSVWPNKQIELGHPQFSFKYVNPYMYVSKYVRLDFSLLDSYSFLNLWWFVRPTMKYWTIYSLSSL